MLFVVCLLFETRNCKTRLAHHRSCIADGVDWSCNANANGAVVGGGGGGIFGTGAAVGAVSAHPVAPFSADIVDSNPRNRLRYQCQWNVGFSRP